MKIVIIEDEFFAAKRLENMIKKYDSKIDILAKLESVSESIAWFSANQQPDLIFLDIHLEDDLSFSIFKQVQITCPFVFTTATDELATQAFLLKEIDFLHKPIIQEDLNQMLDRYIFQKNEPKIFDVQLFDNIINSKKQH
jgi:two-component SAPR family response regulator